MKTEINKNSKRLINEKLFLKFVSYNTSNKEDSKKTLALVIFLIIKEKEFLKKKISHFNKNLFKRFKLKYLI